MICLGPISPFSEVPDFDCLTVASNTLAPSGSTRGEDTVRVTHALCCMFLKYLLTIFIGKVVVTHILLLASGLRMGQSWQLVLSPGSGCITCVP